MTTGIKILIGGLSLAAVVGFLGFTTKGKAIVKKAGSLLIGDSSATTSDNSGILKAGSDDVQHIMQLQDVLNALTTSIQYINKNCGVDPWPVYPLGTLQVNGVFDASTSAASQFYLNRTEVDLDYLNQIRAKIAASNAGSDKCVYPLSINV